MLPVATFATPGTLSVTTTVGSSVLKVKLPPLAGVGLPATSVAMAVTVTRPWPSVATLAAFNVTACAMPVPTSVFGTAAPPAPVSVTTILAPASAVTLTTPAAAVEASRLMTGAGPLFSVTKGATVSMAWSALINTTFGLFATSSTENAFRRRLMLPLEMGTVGVTVTCQTRPLPLTAVTLALMAVKLFTTSPVTASENV